MRKKVIIGSVVFLVGMIALFLTGTIQNWVNDALNPNYIILKNKVILYKNNSGWQEIKLKSRNTGEALSKKYFVYADKNYNGVKLGYQNENLFIIKQKRASKIDGFRIATTNKNVKLADYDLINSSYEDDNLVINVVSDLGGSFTKPYDYQKVVYDFDNDGVSESLYFVTNISLEPDSYIPFSVIFMYKNKNVDIIDKASLYKFDVEEILDLDGDRIYEMIVAASKKVTDTRYDSCYQIYDFTDNKWKIIKKCEI